MKKTFTLFALLLFALSAGAQLQSLMNIKTWAYQLQGINISQIASDTIINQGFDGIYMDIIDGYYYWMVENPQQPVADTLMMQFVKNIRNHVNSVTGNTDFIMIPQNAEEIINSINVSASQKAAYFNAVNAIGVEDVFFER